MTSGAIVITGPTDALASCRQLGIISWTNAYLPLVERAETNVYLYTVCLQIPPKLLAVEA